MEVIKVQCVTVTVWHHVTILIIIKKKITEGHFLVMEKISYNRKCKELGFYRWLKRNLGSDLNSVYKCLLGAEMPAITGFFNLVSKAQNSHGWRLMRPGILFEQCLQIMNIGMSIPRKRLSSWLLMSSKEVWGLPGHRLQASRREWLQVALNGHVFWSVCLSDLPFWSCEPGISAMKIDTLQSSRPLFQYKKEGDGVHRRMNLSDVEIRRILSSVSVHTVN